MDPVPPVASIVGLPQWIEPVLHLTPGRDPLALQTITTDRIIPQVVPGILALSQRARYFSFYAYVLDEFRVRQIAPSKEILSDFIRSREYEFALAVQLCPRGCGQRSSAVVGGRLAAPAVRQDSEALVRGYSVQSFNGGYGLYYRSPMIDLGMVAPAGTMLGDRPTPIDVLMGEPAKNLAAVFRGSIETTAYARDYMGGLDLIPRDVLTQLAEHVCLCRLDDAGDERELLKAILFNPVEPQVQSVIQRSKSFAMLLSLVDRDPEVAWSEPSFRNAVWQAFQEIQALDKDDPYGVTVAQWAALVAKEYLQEGLSTVWSHFCYAGLATQTAEGLLPEEVENLLNETLVGQSPLEWDSDVVRYDLAMPTIHFKDTLAGILTPFSLEAIRTTAYRSAMAGLSYILLLRTRLGDLNQMPVPWKQIARQHSDYQPGLLGFMRQLDEHLTSAPTIGETMAWIVKRYILIPHESIAYNKLPDRTFRFRWEDGRLRFYHLSPDRFNLTDIRYAAMRWISEDIGWLAPDSGFGPLTSAGRTFVQGVFS